MKDLFRLFLLRLFSFFEAFQIKKLLNLFLALFAIWLTGSVLLYACEHGSSSHFSSLSRASWSILVYLFSGFEEYIPATGAGKSLSIFIMVFGVGVIGLFTANIASILIERSLAKNKIPGKPGFIAFSHHLLVCGWSEQAHQVLNLLQYNSRFRRRPVVILDPADSLVFPKVLRKRHIYHISGDFTKEDMLIRADALKADTILIGPDAASHQNGRVLVCAYTLRAMKSRAHIIAFVRTNTHLPAIRRYADEVISHQDVVSRFIAKAVLTKKLSSVYLHLLDTTPATAGIATSRPQAGMAYKSLQEKLKPGILIGYKNEEQPACINPDPQNNGRYTPGKSKPIVLHTAKRSAP